MAGYENGAIFVLRPSPPPPHGQAPAPSAVLALLPMSKHALLALALAPPRERAQGAQEYRGVAGGTGALVYLFSLLLGSGAHCGVASGAVLARVALPGAGVSAAVALGLQAAAPGHWLVGCWDGSVRLVREGEGEEGEGEWDAGGGYALPHHHPLPSELVRLTDGVVIRIGRLDADATGMPAALQPSLDGPDEWLCLPPPSHLRGSSSSSGSAALRRPLALTSAAPGGIKGSGGRLAALLDEAGSSSSSSSSNSSGAGARPSAPSPTPRAGSAGSGSEAIMTDLSPSAPLDAQTLEAAAAAAAHALRPGALRRVNTRAVPELPMEALLHPTRADARGLQRVSELANSMGSLAKRFVAGLSGAQGSSGGSASGSRSGSTRASRRNSGLDEGAALDAFSTLPPHTPAPPAAAQALPHPVYIQPLSYPPQCPTRLDASPLALALLRTLVADLHAAGVDLRADIKTITLKISMAKAAVASASGAADKARAAMAAAESRTLGLLEAKRATSMRLHELVTGVPLPPHPLASSAALGGGGMVKASSAASLEGSSSSSSSNSSSSAPVAVATASAAAAAAAAAAAMALATPATLAASSASASASPAAPPGLGGTSRRGGSAAAAAAASASASAPLGSPPAPHSTSVAAIKKFSASLAALDNSVHEASQAWKLSVWEATMASTRLEELQEARNALSAQLVDVTSDTEARRNALLVATWKALAAVWAWQLGRADAAQKCLEA